MGNPNWQPGRSGNPNGRPKNADSAAIAIKDIISDNDWRNAAKALLSVLVIRDEIQGTIPNPLTNGREKAAAYNALADRAFGKPLQKQEVEAIISPPIDEDSLRLIQARILGDNIDTEEVS